MAQAEMFLSITQALALFDIKGVRDEHGNEIVPLAEFITAMGQVRDSLCGLFNGFLMLA